MADDVRARAERALADPAIPEAAKNEIRAAMQSHPSAAEEAPPESPYLMSEEFDANAQRAREEGTAQRANRLSALKAGAADDQFRARDQGRSGLPLVYDKLLSFLPAFKDPAKREMLRQAGDKGMNDAMAAADDPAAKMTQDLRDTVAPVQGAAAGMAAGGLFGGPGGGLLRALARGAASGGVAGEADATAQGKGPVEALPDAGQGAAAGAGIGAIFHGVGSAGAGINRALRNPESIIGGGAENIQALDAMRDRGAVSKNRTFRTVNDPELAALPKGKPGYYKAAQNARTTIGENTSGDLKAARKEYADGLAAVENDIGHEVHPTDGIMQRMQVLREENTVNGEPLDEKLSAALDKVARMLKKPTGIVSREGHEITAPEATVGEILKIKRGVDKMAAWGMPATDETRPYRIIAKDLAQEAETIDPRIGALNKKYSQAMGKLEETNDILYGKDAPAVADRAAGRRQAAGKLARVGDETAAGSLAQEDLDALAESDPRSARAIRPIKEKKALEATRFGPPRISASPERWGMGAISQNLGAGSARVLDPLMAAIARARGLSLPSAAAGTNDAAKMIWQQLQGQAGPEEQR